MPIKAIPNLETEKFAQDIAKEVAKVKRSGNSKEQQQKVNDQFNGWLESKDLMLWERLAIQDRILHLANNVYA